MACLHIPTPTPALPSPSSSVFPRSTSISANKLYLLIMSTLEKYRAEYLEHPWTQPMTHSPTGHCIPAAAAGWYIRIPYQTYIAVHKHNFFHDSRNKLRNSPFRANISLLFVNIYTGPACADLARVIQIYGPNGRNISDRRNTRQQAEIPATSSNWQGPIRWTHHKWWQEGREDGKRSFFCRFQPL